MINRELTRDEVKLELLDQIIEICFNYDCFVKRGVLHKGFLNKLKQCLEENNFETTLEFPVKFETIRRRDNKQHKRNGFIDLVGIRYNLNIAVEFDTGNHTKFKSIEKLLQSDFDIVVSVVRGKAKNTKLPLSNLEKIKSIHNPNYKKLHLILIENKSVYEVV